jgi:diguanylate cyclase (GGDEF)-like protein
VKLQTKVMLIIAIAWAIICGIIYAYFKLVTTKNYQSLETEIIQHEIQDTQRAYEKMLDALSLYAQAYSQWDDAYDFIIVKNKRFIDSNFTPGIFSSANIEFMMFYNLKKQFYYGGMYNKQSHAIQPVSSDILKYLNRAQDFLTHTVVPSNKIGILNTSSGLILMVSQPLINSDGDKPSRGSLVMGYYLTKDRIDNLSSVVGLKLQLITLSEINQSTSLKKIYSDLTISPFKNFTLINHQMAQGYILLREINKNPIGMMQIDIPRIVYQQGMATSFNYLVILMTSGLLVMILTWYLLKVFILGRIISINNQISNIAKGNHFNQTISLSGHDELSSLVLTINHMIGIITQSQERLQYLATYDSLTHLPNRAHFYELLSSAITRANKNRNKIALMFIDMDKLKSINDSCGHDIGDKLIEATAHRMQRVIKSTDVIARQSGDEFLLLLENITEMKQASDTALRLLGTTASPFVIENIIISITFSIGISLYPNDGLTAEELIKSADQAMYKAKIMAGNQYQFYEEEKSYTT